MSLLYSLQLSKYIKLILTSINWDLHFLRFSDEVLDIYISSIFYLIGIQVITFVKWCASICILLISMFASEDFDNRNVSICILLIFMSFETFITFALHLYKYFEMSWLFRSVLYSKGPLCSYNKVFPSQEVATLIVNNC